jgi:nitrogen fixation protein FixH
VPDGATRVIQIATGGTSQMAQMAFGARATARVVTNCKITTKGSVRTYTCRANLGAGRWTLTTQAKAGATVIAQSVKHVTVKGVKRTAVTG